MTCRQVRCVVSVSAMPAAMPSVAMRARMVHHRFVWSRVLLSPCVRVSRRGQDREFEGIVVGFAGSNRISLACAGCPRSEQQVAS